ncbi:ferrochelatase [Limnoglobus roseus]|uniref:Ferrochelatase n=1 Tax=Limnoglobus roseus TaxID=2598579 RepID=A0A5C1ATT4_9BACT|nr:ferrochelatase [Limnoglobus roseus]QEL20178.1 ferrochelatase [Limnoglobus roseus]
MTGLLLIQLGTPDAPTAEALRPYLRQFLFDPRVVETRPDTARYLMPGKPRPPRKSPPQWLWTTLMKTVILPFRPKDSAAKYARIWDAKTGSPLLHHTIEQTRLLQERFTGTPVRFGMIVGNPTVETAVAEMIAAGVDRMVVLPMFPQYSSTTVASATDTLAKLMLKLRVVPAIRTVPSYYNHPAYVEAMAAVVRDDLAALGWEPEHVLFSFHGIPQKYAQRGDPYPSHCVRTTQLLVEKLGWPRDRWTQTYQSRFGKEPWLKPYTDDVLQSLAKQGRKRVAVVLPGFTADCLETVDEIGRESEEVFRHAGGEKLHVVPCLNEHPKWIDALEQIFREEGQGWL